MQNIKLIGKRIKEIRKNKRISQEKLAELISMNYRSILRIENSQTIPTIDTLQKNRQCIECKNYRLFRSF